MSKRDGLEIALKILAVYFITQGIAVVSGMLLMLPTMGPHGSWEWTGLLIGLPWSLPFLVMGFVLLWLARSLAVKMIREDAPVPELTNLHFGPEAFAFGLRIVGIVTFIKGLSYAVQAVVAGTVSRDPMLPAPNIYPPTANALLYLAIGLYLISGAKHFVKIVYRVPAPKSGDVETS